MNSLPDSDGAGQRESSHRESTPYVRRTTSDRDEAEGIVTQLYLPNRLKLPPDAGPLVMELAAMRLGSLTAGRLTYGQPVRLRTADARNFHMNIPLRGRAVSRRGSAAPVTTRAREGLVFSPGAPADIVWSADCELLCLMVPRGCLEAQLERLLGRPVRGGLIFEFAANAGQLEGRPWETLVSLLADVLAEPTHTEGNPYLARHLEALVIDGLLLRQPHNQMDAAFGVASGSLAPSIRRAVELVEDRPAEPWTTVGLASQVHLSVRALQDGFRRDLDTPPMTYVRQVRLRRAREALLAADRDATTVQSIATGLGIIHLGRFAAAYREAFGESPSQTLNRAG